MINLDKYRNNYNQIFKEFTNQDYIVGQSINSNTMNAIVNVLQNTKIEPLDKIKMLAKQLELNATDIYNNILPDKAINMILSENTYSRDEINQAINHSDYKFSIVVCYRALTFKRYNMTLIHYITIMMALGIPKELILSTLGFPSYVQLNIGSITKYLKLARIENLLNKKELAEKSKISVSTYNRIERYVNDPANDNLSLASIKIDTLIAILKQFHYKNFDFDLYAPAKYRIIANNIPIKQLGNNTNSSHYNFHVLKNRTNIHLDKYADIMRRIGFKDSEIVATLKFSSDTPMDINIMVSKLEKKRQSQKMSKKQLCQLANISYSYYNSVLMKATQKLSVYRLYNLMYALDQHDLSCTN